MKIKFRAWDNERNCFYYGKELIIEYYTPDGEEYFLNSPNEDDCGDYYENFIMQYIGLKDKNGIDVYPKDIVKIRFNIDEVEDYIYMSLTDKEKEQSYVIKVIDEFPYCFTQPEINAPDIEVIGNIYENPELLKQEE